MYEKEKGISSVFERKYPLDIMEVGDSFLVPLEKRASAASMCSKYRKASGKKFITRKVEGGFRVWRVSSKDKI